MEPGDYAIPFAFAADTDPWGEVEVPAGWGQDRLLLAPGQDLDPHLRRVELLAVNRVAPDPCDGKMLPVGGSVSDVVEALTEQRTVCGRAVRSVSRSTGTPVSWCGSGCRRGSTSRVTRW